MPSGFVVRQKKRDFCVLPFRVCPSACGGRTSRGPEAAKSFSCTGICPHPSPLIPGGFLGLRDWCRRVNVPINGMEPRQRLGTIKQRRSHQLMQARHSHGNPGSPRRKTRPQKAQSDFGKGGSRRKTWPGFPASTRALPEPLRSRRNSALMLLRS